LGNSIDISEKQPSSKQIQFEFSQAYKRTKRPRPKTAPITQGEMAWNVSAFEGLFPSEDGPGRAQSRKRKGTKNPKKPIHILVSRLADE
jgi:hypothetical protein